MDENSCKRLHGGSVLECDCFQVGHLILHGSKGPLVRRFAECPPAARKVIDNRQTSTTVTAMAAARMRRSAPTGDICDYCGSADLRRTGPCLTCNNCGESGGCG
jgi:hypothetical protein